MKNKLKTISGICLLSLAGQSHALLCTSEGVTNNGNEIIRNADLTIANACHSGDGNPQTSDINTLFGNTPSWTQASDIVGIEGSNGSVEWQGFTIDLTSGFWGGTDIEGTWAINESFWNNYDEAVISMHVGGQPGDGIDDFFAWSIPTDTTDGTFDYFQETSLNGGGGGLSNFKLWGRSSGIEVPEPGSIALLALGLLGLGFSRKFSQKA